MKSLYRDLRRIPLDEAFRDGGLFITMGEQQWDVALADAYRAGWVLIEVDAEERPIAAYKIKTNDAEL